MPLATEYRRRHRRRPLFGAVAAVALVQIGLLLTGAVSTWEQRDDVPAGADVSRAAVAPWAGSGAAVLVPAPAADAPKSNPESPSIPSGSDDPVLFRGAMYYEVPAPTPASRPAMPPQLPRPAAPPTVRQQPVESPRPAPSAETVNAPFLSGLPATRGRKVKFPEAVERWRSLIEPMAKQAGIEPALVLAIIEQESGGNPFAVSRAGARGLMQLMPGTFKAYVPDGEIFDPRHNAFAGVYYLRDSLWYHGGDVAWALAGYNGGINGTRRVREEEGELPWDYGGGETIRYVYAVWWNYYRALTAE